jgi:hypothetical protein
MAPKPAGSAEARPLCSDRRDERETNVALTQDDRTVLDHLADVGELYERYLRIAKIAQVPSPDEQEQAALEAPQRVDLPLTLRVRDDVGA